MNVTTMLIGAVAIVFGFYTLYLRKKHPEKLVKLEAMKQRFGANTGSLAHLVAYSVLPLMVGVIFVYSGFLGVALF